MINYGLDFTPASLFRLTAIEISKHIWGEFNTKRNVKELLSSTLMPSGSESSHSEGGKCALLTQVTNQIDKLLLPKPAKDEMIFVAESMGLTMFEWFKIMNEQGKFIEIDVQNYVDNIRWTQLGGIDTADTVRSLYFSKSITDDIVAWREICNHCLEDCITHYWLKHDMLFMKPTLDCASTTGFSFSQVYLPLYWYYFKYNNVEAMMVHFRKFSDTSQWFLNDFTIESAMFLVSVCSRNHSAIKYFWTVLCASERRKLIIAIPKSEAFTHFLANSRKCHDSIIFLWNQFAIYSQFNPLPIILRAEGPREIITYWPWQDILMATLERISNDIKDNEYKETMHCIINILNDHHRKSVHFKYCQIFLKLWKKSPADVQKATIADQEIRKALISIGDIELFERIVNDSALMETKQRILTTFAEGWRDNLKCFNMQLDEFLMRLCSSRKDKEWFENLIFE